MAKAKQMPNGKWRLRSFVGTDPNGKKIFQSFTCDTEAACYKAERSWLKTGGKTAAEENLQEKGPTIGEALEAYIVKCTNSKTKAYSPATITGYRVAQRALSPYHGLYVSDLTMDDLQDIVDQRAMSVKKKTIVNELYLLKPALKMAKRKDLDFDELELPEQEKEDYIIPTDDEIQELLEHFSDDLQMQIVIAMGAFLGMRRSEIAGAQYGDLDQEANTLHITRAMVANETNTYEIKATKTAAGRRTVEVPVQLVELIRKRFRREGRIPQAAESITGLTPTQISGRFRRARETMKFDYTFHGLRHYHASVMLALDIPQKYIVADMGHADFTMVQKVYGQVVEAKKKAISDAVTGHADTILGGGKYSWG